MSPAARQLALVNTAISFAAGLLAGYIIRDFYNRLKRRRQQQQQQQNNNNNDQPQRIERVGQQQQHCDNNTRTTNSQVTGMNKKGGEGERDDPDGVAAAAAAGARPAIPKCQSSEDIFFDAPCDR